MENRQPNAWRWLKLGLQTAHPVANTSKAPAPLSLWIGFCALCGSAGWGLSLLHQLNWGGYAVTLVLGLVLLALFRRQFAGRMTTFSAHKLARRFRRPFPVAFLALLSLAMLGGVLYPPCNADAMSQRIPRLLNWLAEQRWHWIDNAPGSFNTRAAGFEWLMAPMIALLRTDRFVFLLNVCSYLLFPGLVFSVFTRLGVSRRAAWNWMWLLPTGYCFILQAGSIGNDAVGAVFALAALDFALRARESRSCADLWLSCLAVALLTASKTSNLTLLLPWLLAAWPSLRLLTSRPLASSGIFLVAAACSFLPTAALNYHYVRDWSGASYELSADLAHVKPHVAFVGNGLNLLVQNLTPPLFPAANWWNNHAHKAIPLPLRSQMEKSFEPSGAHIKVREMPLESEAALGFGLTLLVLCSWVAARLVRRSLPAVGSAHWDYRRLVRLAPWVSLLVYMMKISLSASGRILAPYYALLMPSLLTGPGQEKITRHRLWRTAGLGVFCLAAILVVLNPVRPLWPATRTIAWLEKKLPSSRALARARMVYQSYVVRWDALGQVRSSIPSQEKNVGFLAFVTTTTLETSLWRPFGERRIRWVRADDSSNTICGKGIHFVVIGADSPDAPVCGRPFQDWLQDWTTSHNGKVVGSFSVSNVASKPPSPWFVVELLPAGKRIS